MPGFKLQIDQSLCDGFGSCVETAPAVFALGADGIAVAREGLANEDEVIDAARGCPMSAIAVFDADTGEQVA